MKILVKEYPCFYLYKHVFDSGNSYMECESKWKRTDFSGYVACSEEDRIERHLDTMVHRRTS